MATPGEDVEELEPSYVASGNAKMLQSPNNKIK